MGVVYTLYMDLDEIIAEMQRRPDAQTLIEWIDVYATDIEQARDAINAYERAVEAS